MDRNNSLMTYRALSFKVFLFVEKRNRQLLILSGIAILVQFIIFKFLYPYADFFSDSYSYLYAASANLNVSIWPIGYSKFLRAFHELTHSDTALVAFQYFFLELSSLYLFFTVLYFYNPGRAVRNILFIFLFLNPLFLYLSNYVNSDPLFASLSLIWLTELIWILNRSRIYHIFTQAIFLFLAFTVRNNAYYYPFIAILVFILTRQKWWFKLAGSLLGLALIIPFILRTRTVAKQMTGTAQFSLFTGWQLANNALYMYGHINSDTMLLPSLGSRELDRITRKFYSTVPPDFSDILSDYVANYFIRQPESPLKKYYYSHYKYKDQYTSVVNWGKASVVYGEWASSLIKQHPAAFVRYFMLLNTKNYLLPPLEKLEIYNLGQDDVENIAQDWFDYKSPEVNSISKELQGKILFLYPYLFCLLNFYFLITLCWFIFKRKYSTPNSSVNDLLLLSVCFWLANFAFCIGTTILVFRYEVFPMIVCLVSSSLLFQWMDEKIPEKEKTTKQAELLPTQPRII